MTISGSTPPRESPAPRLAEVVALACISAAMYRLQQTGDPLMIVWGAGAIIVLTVAATIARAVERRLSRVFGIWLPDDDDADDE
jgi:uncharacterized membrane protein YedE/YeeE